MSDTPTPPLHTRFLRWLSRLRSKAGGPPPVPPAWEGACCCCGKYVYANHVPDLRTEASICLACIVGITPEGKERLEKLKLEEADRRNIEMIKTALREIEAEKGKTNQ